MTWSIHLPVPPRNQVTDPTDDGQLNEDWELQCGCACVAEVIEYKTGTHLSVDRIHDEILGQGALGITYNDQLVNYLNGLYPSFRYNLGAKTIVPAHTTPLNGPGSLLNVEWSYLVNDNPVIGLFWYDHVGNLDKYGKPIFHWRTIKGMDPTYVWSNDSIWESGDLDFNTAYERIESYQQHQSLSQQLLVVVGTHK